MSKFTHYTLTETTKFQAQHGGIATIPAGEHVCSAVAPNGTTVYYWAGYSFTSSYRLEILPLVRLSDDSVQETSPAAKAYHNWVWNSGGREAQRRAVHTLTSKGFRHNGDCPTCPACKGLRAETRFDLGGL